MIESNYKIDFTIISIFKFGIGFDWCKIKVTSIVITRGKYANYYLKKVQIFLLIFKNNNTIYTINFKIKKILKWISLSHGITFDITFYHTLIKTNQQL